MHSGSSQHNQSNSHHFSPPCELCSSCWSSITGSWIQQTLTSIRLQNTSKLGKKDNNTRLECFSQSAFSYTCSSRHAMSCMQHACGRKMAVATNLSFPSVVESIICHEEDNPSESSFHTSSTAVPPTNDILTCNNLNVCIII